METLLCSHCGRANLASDRRCSHCGASTTGPAPAGRIDQPTLEVDRNRAAAVPKAPAKPSPSLVGSLVGQYRIVELLGKGGFGEVYRARDTALGRQAAIKLLPPETSQDPDSQRRFKREAKAASALNHPNICTIYHLGGFKGRNFIAMELVQGLNLQQLLWKRTVEVDEAVQIGLQMASGLSAAHRRGIIHRDIKSANVILSDEGRVKILDFGIAKRLERQRIHTGRAVDQRRRRVRDHPLYVA